MRGTYFQERVLAFEFGLIPAGAGNITKFYRTVRGGQAHPRRCGEHPRLATHPLLFWGSSPQVRGTLVLEKPRGAVSGLIPAGAGNIFLVLHSPRRLWGSSPQVRGTLPRLVLTLCRGGLIPAGAGNI